MKKLLTSALLVIFISSCNEHSEIDYFNYPSDAECKVPFHGISYQQTADLASEYIFLYNEITHGIMGGYLNANTLGFTRWEEALLPGVQYFFCATPNVQDPTKIDSLFIAYRVISNYDPLNPDFNIEDDAEFYKSSMSYNYTGEASADFPLPQAAIEYLERNGITRFEENTTLMGSEVREDVATFNGFFPDECEYPGGFFIAPEINAVLSQSLLPPAKSIAGLRFAFGHDFTADENKIKIQMVAVDDQGKSLIVKPDGTHYYMVERSWPPSAN